MKREKVMRDNDEKMSESILFHSDLLGFSESTPPPVYAMV
jgi:hypothetical protein